MPNTSDYKYTDLVPTHEIEGWFENEKGLLQYSKKQLKGLTPFGPQGGVLTEDKLSPGVVEHLLNSVDDKGEKIYEKYLTKKNAKDK